jgi:hypothetical protein
MLVHGQLKDVNFTNGSVGMIRHGWDKLAPTPQ